MKVLTGEKWLESNSKLKWSKILYFLNSQQKFYLLKLVKFIFKKTYHLLFSAAAVVVVVVGQEFHWDNGAGILQVLKFHFKLKKYTIYKVIPSKKFYLKKRKIYIQCVAKCQLKKVMVGAKEESEK